MAIDPITTKVFETIIAAIHQIGTSALRRRAEFNCEAKKINFDLSTNATSPFRITFSKPPNSKPTWAMAGFIEIDGNNHHSPYWQPVSIGVQLESKLPGGRYRIVVLYLDDQQIPEILGVGLIESVKIFGGQTKPIKVPPRADIPLAQVRGHRLKLDERMALHPILERHGTPLQLPSIDQSPGRVIRGEVL